MPTKRSPKLIIINFTICGAKKGFLFYFLAWGMKVYDEGRQEENLWSLNHRGML